MIRQNATLRFGILVALLLVACAEGDIELLDDSDPITGELTLDQLKQNGVDSAVTRITKKKLFKCGDLEDDDGRTRKCRKWRNRIPSLLLAGSGRKERLIAFVNKRKESKHEGNRIHDYWHETDVLARISRDRGQTWSDDIVVASRDNTDIHRGPVIVVENQNKTVIYQFMRYVPDGEKRGLKPSDYKKEATIEEMRADKMGDYVTHSKDLGQTWSEPIPVELPYPAGARGVGVGNGNHGIRLSNGRIVIQARYREMENGKLKSKTVLFYTDANKGLRKGRKWKLGARLDKRGVSMSSQEFTLTESPRNVVLANFRTCDVDSGRVKVRIDNAVEVTEEANHDASLHAAIVHASMARDPDGFETYFFGIPGGQHPQPGECSQSRFSRRKMSLYKGNFDGSQIDWGRRLKIDKNSRFAGYSDMVVFDDGTVGILYESGDSLDKDDIFEYMTYQHLEVND